jgi:hypothetical protein
MESTLLLSFEHQPVSNDIKTEKIKNTGYKKTQDISLGSLEI